jgi:hypothetical protein
MFHIRSLPYPLLHIRIALMPRCTSSSSNRFGVCPSLRKRRKSGKELFICRPSCPGSHWKRIRPDIRAPSSRDQAACGERCRVCPDGSRPEDSADPHSARTGLPSHSSLTWHPHHPSLPALFVASLRHSLASLSTFRSHVPPLAPAPPPHARATACVCVVTGPTTAGRCRLPTWACPCPRPRRPWLPLSPRAPPTSGRPTSPHPHIPTSPHPHIPTSPHPHIRTRPHLTLLPSHPCTLFAHG